MPRSALSPLLSMPPLLLVIASLLLLVQVQVLVLFASAAIATTAATTTTAPRFDAMLRFAAQQYSAEYAQWLQSPDQYPHVASPFNKSWTNTNSYQPFTAGFYPGILWQLHNYFTLINDTDEANAWLERAVAVTPGNAPAANMTTTHDIGFVIDNSFINGYRATKNVSYLPVIELAAHSLATRYSPIVQCTRSWNSDTGFLVIIDNMMNIELLNWAGQQFGNATWTDMAWHHAHRTMSSHFRADFSTYQVVEFNETDGSIVAYHTKQGYNVTSTWTRGQAWGTWGFTRAYAYSQYTPFLQRAIDAASLFLTRLHVESPDSVPWWDFDAPYQTGQEPHDSSAGAIVASGMIELGHTLDELRRAAAIGDARALRTLRELDLTGGRGVDAQPFDFIEESLWILGNLSSYAYSLDGHPEYPLPALLTRATGNRPSNQNVNVSIIWGDYYYVEAMVRYSTWYPQDVVEVGVGVVTPVEEGEKVVGDDASSVRGRTWWSRKIAPHKNAHAAAAAATMKDDAQHPSQPIAVKM